MIFGLNKGKARFLCQEANYFGGKAGWRIQPGPRGCPPKSQFHKACQCQFDTLSSQSYLPGVAAELLSQTHGRGILKMGASYFDDRVELLAFCFQFMLARFESFH